MNSVLYRIRALYDHMGRAEKKIADHILENPTDVVRFSVSELAEACHCGDATVVRFSKRLGLDGYQSLKIALARTDTSEHPAGSVEVSADDSSYDIFIKRVEDISRALKSTEAALDPAEMERATAAIMHAERIVLFGLGSSASVTIDAQHKFTRVGLNAVAYNDSHMQVIAAAHLHPGDVAIGVSHSGCSTDVVDALREAHENGATTVCVTNCGVSPIVGCSDIRLYTAAEETRYTILALSSRIAQLAIFDSLYTAIVMKSGKDVQDAIRKTEDVLRRKKY